MKKLVLAVISLFISLSALSTALTASAIGTNLISNPSAETQSGSEPSGWNQDKWGTNTAAFTYKTNEGHTGTKSLYVNMTKRTSGDAKWYFTHIPVKPNTKYTYSEFYKSNVGTEVDIEYANTSGSLSYAWLGTPAASTTSWTNKSFTFTTPVNVKTLTILHVINKVGWLQTDDFSLVEGDGNVTPPAPTAPAVSLTSPANNATVSGTQAISANASDAVSVAGVQFKVDGANVGAEDTVAPYSINWDTKTAANGNHTLTAVARNTGDLTTASSAVTVDVQNVATPTVSFTNPAANSTISGPQGVAASASADTVGVQFKLDGNNLGAEDTSAPFSINWDSTSVGNGNHTLNAVARNAAGLTATATETVNVQNIVTPPPTSINLITNPSFETSDGTAPANWLSSSWGTNTSAFSYLTTGHTGSRSVKVETTAYTNGAANWYYADIPVTAGKTYKYENWYQSNVDTEVDAEVVMTDGSVQYYWLGTVLASTNWAKFSTTFTAPVGAKSVSIYQILAKKGYIISDDYSLSEYTPAPLNRGLVTVTFDDGWTSQYQNALPILNKYGLKATFYMISGELNNQPDYMSTSQVQNLYAQGMEIGSHTITHSDLTQVSQSKLVQEMSQSQTTLQNVIGVPVVNFAYPYGAYNASTISVGQQYYRSQRSVNQGYNTRDNFDITQLKIFEVDSNISNAQVQGWIQGAIAQNAWVILVYHEIGASIGGDIYNASTANFETQMNYLKNSGAAVVTLNQALNEILPQL